MPPDGIPAVGVGATGGAPLATLEGFAAEPQPSVIVRAAANHRRVGTAMPEIIAAIRKRVAGIRDDVRAD